MKRLILLVVALLVLASAVLTAANVEPFETAHLGVRIGLSLFLWTVASFVGYFSFVGK